MLTPWILTVRFSNLDSNPSVNFCPLNSTIIFLYGNFPFCFCYLWKILISCPFSSRLLLKHPRAIQLHHLWRNDMISHRNKLGRAFVCQANSVNMNIYPLEHLNKLQTYDHTGHIWSKLNGDLRIPTSKSFFT